MWRKVTKFDISRKIRATRELKLSSSCVEYLELSQHSRTPFGTTAVSNQPMCDNASAVAEAIVSTSPEEYEEMRELNSEMSMQRRKEVKTFPAKERSVIHGMSQGKHNALRKRQTMVETEAWNEAAREYQEFLTIMCEKKLFPNLPPIKSLFLGRSEPLRDAINAEQDLCKTGKNRGGYAPYFDELPAVMMKVITMQKLMGLSMSSGCHGSATLASIQIGEAIEHGLAIPEEPDTDEETAIRKWKWKDGSCNGLQHYAALGRDKVDTKLVKQTVMTSVYGVPYIGTQDQIKRRLKACDAIADTEVFAAVCYAAKVMIEVAIPSSMVMLPKFPVETIVLSNLYAAVAMKTSNGDYFHKCDAFHLSTKWSTESDSFVILDNTADSFHKNRLKKVERSDLDHKAACSWISLYVSSPGQAILHATFSKPIDFGFSRQIVLKASASIASFLPVTVHQPGDGNNIGGYWFDLEKVGNNDRSGISDELFLVRGASLDVILVGGPRGWEKGVDLVETVDILYERSPYNIKGLVYQVPILEGNGYRVLCQKAGNFTVILKRGNLIGDDHQESVVAKTNLHLECSFPSSIVVLADITVNKLDVIQNAILADIGAGYLLSTPVTVANGRTIGVSALGISMSGKASANEPHDSEVSAVGWGRNRALKNASGQDGSIAIIEPETHAVDGTELANLRPPEDDDIAIIAPELYPLDEIKLGNLRAPEWLYQSTVKQLRLLYPTTRVVVHTDASLKKMDGVGWVCSMAHVGRDIETGEIIWYATGFCDVVSGDSNVGELIGMVYAVYMAKCLGIEELILKCDNEHSLKMVKKALRDVKNKEMIELYLRLQELLEGMNVTPLWISDEAEKQVADCLSRAEMNGGVDRKKLISKFLKLVEKDIKSKRKLD